MKTIGIGIIFFLYLLISGCSTSGELPFHEHRGEESEERFEPPPGLGNLYIVRKMSLIGAGAVSLKVNGQFIGKIEQSNYHLLELAPGEYIISAEFGKREAKTKVDVAAGKNHFVQIEPGVYYKSDLLVKQIDAEKGREMVGVGFRLATLPVEIEREQKRCRRD